TRRRPATRRRLAGPRKDPAGTRGRRAGRGPRRIPGRVTVSVAGDPEQPPRVVIADDQTLVRGGFRLILTLAGIPVVAEAADGKEAIAATLKHRPDVVLMDIRMPVMDGLEATRRILESRPGQNTRVIMLTTFDLDQYVYAALAAGASGFLLKDVSPEHLVAAVQLVRTGDALLAPSITRRLIERFAPPAAEPGVPGRDLSVLTPRELRAPRPRVAGTVHRGPRRRAHAQRSDGEDAGGEDPRQARPARPRAGGHPRLRDRPDLPRPSRARLGTRLAELRGPCMHGLAPSP